MLFGERRKERKKERRKSKCVSTDEDDDNGLPCLACSKMRPSQPPQLQATGEIIETTKESGNKENISINKESKYGTYGTVQQCKQQETTTRTR